jgi:DNA-binding GntR family transcriptional regulator
VAPKVERHQPPYLQITQHYRELIQSGELRDGDRLPSARQLVEQWEVAHATAAKVLSTLRAEGLVKTMSGGAGGTTVSVQPVGQSPRDHMTAIRRSGNIYPKGEHAKIVSAELVAAPEQVAQALGVQPGDQVIRRHRITYRDDSPISASTSWFTADLVESAPDLLVPARIKMGTPGYIEQQTGRRVRRGRDQLTAMAADKQAAADLGLAQGTAILCARNWYRDQQGDVLEYGEYVAPSGRWQTYDYEVD